jgi:hypothetical protein
MSRAIPLPDAGDRAKAVTAMGDLVVYREALGGRLGDRARSTGWLPGGGGAQRGEGVLPLPFDHSPAPVQVFGPLRGAVPPPLAGRVGVVATCGSGTLASLAGVAKALEDSGTRISVYRDAARGGRRAHRLGAPRRLHRHQVARDRHARPGIGARLMRHHPRRQARGVLPQPLRRPDAGTTAGTGVCAGLGALRIRHFRRRAWHA